ncbi:MAG TPA: hypothetical protein VFK80_06875 [Limnochordia bacterium]|nr:hypothetical protein [Limnochordia bacterium]
MSPQDIIWRALSRLQETKEVLAETGDLHPRRNADLIDALAECERLAQAQVNILNRMRRRYESE